MLSTKELRDYLNEKFIGSQITIPERELETIPQIDIELPTPKGTFSEPDESEKNVDNESLVELKWSYLDDDPLSKSFGYKRDLQKPCKIALCLYDMNESANLPFLQFLFEKKEESYQLPSTDLNMQQFETLIQSFQQIAPEQSQGEEEVDDDDQDEIEDEFLSQCSQYVQKISGIAESSYKGFIEMGDTIYVVYDCAGHYDEIPDGSPYIWVTLDEIINKKRILDVPIVDPTVDFFIANSVIRRIKYDNGEAVETPIVGYLCTQNGEEFKNTYYAEGSTRSLINPMMEHPLLGNVYLFSYNPTEYENLNKIKRYVLFVRDTLYLSNNNFPLSDFFIETENEPNNFIKTSKNYSWLCFYDKEKEFWSTKESDLFTEL